MTRAPSNEFLGLPYRYAQGRILWARAFARNLGLGSYLAFVAGAVNSIAFLALGTYVSHISGHATRSAVEYSEGHYSLAASFFLATALFIGGATLTTICLRGQSLEDRTRRFAIPVVLEFLVLVSVLVISHLNLAEPPNTFVYLFSFAMGLQNALIRQASGTIVRTTHMTGVATDMGIAMGTAFLSFVAETRLALREVWRWRLVLVVVRAFVRVFRFERFLLHLTIFTSFLVGAMVGTLGYQKYAFDILYCPLAVLGIIIVRELQPRRRRQKDRGLDEGQTSLR